MMMMCDGPPKERGKHRSQVENQMIRRREREFKHHQMWAGAEDYFKRWEQNNTKYDEWTSPRYYQDNNRLISDVRKKKDQEELLAKRKEKLRKLLEEEDRTYQIELMVKKNLNIGGDQSAKSSSDDVSTETLKDVNEELKRKDEEKRKREAELGLYHQWRLNNPIVRQFESKYRFKDLKLSWLDQQIEKRMQKENEEKATKKFIKEQEERLKAEKKKEEAFRKELEEKRQELKENLEQQMKELQEKQRISDELRKKEDEQAALKLKVQALEERSKEEERRRVDREYALFNVKQHKLKLKQKAQDVQENLNKDKEFILKLKQFELEDIIRDETRKKEIRKGLEEFLDIVKAQQELEKQREKQLAFLFDSEAKAIYDKHMNMWKTEEVARKKLLKDVLDTVKKQVAENIEKNKERQAEMLQEREQITKNIEEYDKELQELKIKEENQKRQRKHAIDEEIKLKNARKKQEENHKLKEIDEELERVRREEERLQKEIMAIQRRQGPVRPIRSSRLFY